MVHTAVVFRSPLQRVFLTACGYAVKRTTFLQLSLISSWAIMGHHDPFCRSHLFPNNSFHLWFAAVHPIIQGDARPSFEARRLRDRIFMNLEGILVSTTIPKKAWDCPSTNCPEIVFDVEFWKGALSLYAVFFFRLFLSLGNISGVTHMNPLDRVKTFILIAGEHWSAETQNVYPLVIKRGWLESPPILDDFPSYKPLLIRDFPVPRPFFMLNYRCGFKMPQCFLLRPTVYSSLIKTPYNWQLLTINLYPNLC